VKHSDGIKAHCEALGPEYGITAEIAERIQTYAAHLEKWQKAINLVSKNSLPEMWMRHVYDSLQIVPHIPDTIKTIVDLGSGAGFPGLILALFDRWDVHLIESDQRKSIFLRDSARTCGATVTVHAQRIETVTGVSADLITARALASLDELLEMASGFRHFGTQHLFLKGQGADQELTDAQKNWKLRVTKIPSLTDPLGAILNIDEVSHNGS